MDFRYLARCYKLFSSSSRSRIFVTCLVGVAILKFARSELDQERKTFSGSRRDIYGKSYNDDNDAGNDKNSRHYQALAAEQIDPKRIERNLK